MKTTKRTLAAFLAAMLFCTLLSACNGGTPAGSGGSAASTGKTDTNTNAGTGDGKKIVLEYTTWGSTNEKDVQTKMMKAFSDSQDKYEVHLTHIPDQYETKLTTMFAAGNEPDFMLLNKQTGLQWQEDGKLYNLYDFVYNDPEFDPASLMDNAVVKSGEEKVSGVKSCDETFAIFYNQDAFAEAGVEKLPTTPDKALTYDEFVDIAKKLTLDGNGKTPGDPDFDETNVRQFGVYLPNWEWFTFVFNDDNRPYIGENGELNLYSDAVMDRLQDYVDLVVKHKVAPSPTQTKNLPTSAVSLQSRRCAMILDGQWVQLDLGVANVNFDIGLLPKFVSNKAILYGETWAISQNSEHPEGAWEAMKYCLMNPDNVTEIYSSGLWMPQKKDWYTEKENLDKWATVAPGHSEGFVDVVVNNTLENGINHDFYFMKNTPKIEALVTPALDECFLGKKTVREAFAEIRPQLEKEWKGVYYLPED